MELQEIIQDMQSSLDRFQLKLNLLKTLQTGQVYEVDILMTRKEAAYFLGRSTRQLDRLIEQNRIKREIVDGTVRIRRSSLVEYLGGEVRPFGKDTEFSEFERLYKKYNTLPNHE